MKNHSKIVIILILISLMLIMNIFVIIDRLSGDNILPTSNDEGKLIDLGLDCDIISIYAESKGISEIEAKDLECKYNCGLIDLELNGYECLDNKFHCYCK